MRNGLFVVGSTLLLAIAASSQNQARPNSQTTDPRPTSTAAERENYDPLLDLPPLPHNEVTLIGGTVVRLDEIMNRMVVQPFGGKQKLNMAFDTRTHFYQRGKPISERETIQGKRASMHTIRNAR